MESIATRDKLGAVVTYDIVSSAVLVFLSLIIAFVRPSSRADASKHRGLELDEVTPVFVPHIEPRRALVYSLLSVIALTYFADGALDVIRAVLGGSWAEPGFIGLFSYVLGLAAFSILAISLSWKDVQSGSDPGGAWGNRRTRLFVALAVIFHVAHIILLVATGDLQHRTIPVGIPDKLQPPKALYSPFLHLGISVLRLLILVPLYLALASPYRTFVPYAQVAGEGGAPMDSTSTNGLGEPAASTGAIEHPPDAASRPPFGLFAPQQHYGTFSSSINEAQQPPQAARQTARPAKSKTVATGPINKNPSWRETGARLKRLLPYLWPRGSLKLEGLAFFCLILLGLGRYIMFLSPTTLRKLVAVFDHVQDVSVENLWKLVLLYVFLRFLQGSGGLSSLRDVAWIPVRQYSDRRMSQMTFDHLLNLSLAFHTSKKTGEVLSILDRAEALNQMSETILFTVFPALLDIVVALIIFSVWFNATLTAVVFLAMSAYITSAIVITSMRTNIRRQKNEKATIVRGIHTDTLLNYETVKYFGGEQHEAERYRFAIEEDQVLQFKVMATFNLLNLVQNSIISLGLLIGSILVTTEVVNGTKQTSDFVFFITYVAQIYAPLHSLGAVYRSITQSLVDTEKLFKLLDERRDINDKPGAPDLVVTNGEIEFKNVSFTYDDRTTALKDVSFRVPTGSSVALVGESGSGKSTILRLLYRFYDLNEGDGAILIDGQDIRDITQSSLRRAIGVVPQDSVLFNNTIAYNLKYGKYGASQGEIEYAAQAAQMHERILSFPDGYDTRVGERGVRLSGGEKQRISIARTFLKNAPILLLDEATSALDTTTEKDIQKALQNLLTGRSSLSIAHRLSTIANSDTILVLKGGQIIESGNHKELLAANGVFAAMWAEQVTAENENARPGLGIPSEGPKPHIEGYGVAALTAGPKAALDVTETPVGREVIILTERRQKTPEDVAVNNAASPEESGKKEKGKK